MDYIKIKLTDKFKDNKYADKILFEISMFEQFSTNNVKDVNANINLIKNDIIKEKEKIIQNNIHRKQKINYLIIFTCLLISIILMQYSISENYIIFYLFPGVPIITIVIMLYFGDETDSLDQLIDLCEKTIYVIKMIEK